MQTANTTTARAKEHMILPIQEPPQRPPHLARVVEILKGLHPSSWRSSNHNFNTFGLCWALWARASAGACRVQSPASGWFSAGLSTGLVKLGSDSINRGWGHVGVTEVIPVFSGSYPGDPDVCLEYSQ